MKKSNTLLVAILIYGHQNSPAYVEERNYYIGNTQFNKVVSYVIIL